MSKDAITWWGEGARQKIHVHVVSFKSVTGYITGIDSWTVGHMDMI
jgi:maltoporin